MIERIRQQIKLLRARDAGLVRLKKSVRVVSAASLALLLLALIRLMTPLINSPRPLFVGGLASMQLMMLTMGQSRRIQKSSMLITAGIILCETVFIRCTFGTPIMQNGVLFVLAFFAFYTRRYGLHFVGIGLASVFSYMVFTFMLSPDTPILPTLTAVVLASGIAFLVNFYFLPERPVAAYRDAVKQFLFCAYQNTEILVDLLRHPHPCSAAEYSKQVEELQQAYEKADNISGFIPIQENQTHADIQILLNRVNGSFMMMLESIFEAQQITPPMNEQIRSRLVTCLSLLHDILSAEILIPIIDQQKARELTEDLDKQTKELHNELANNPNIFSRRLFYLARASFCLRRLNTALHDWQNSNRINEQQGENK